MTRPNLDPHRCKTVLYLRRRTLSQVATECRVTVRHLAYVLAGQRPGSQRVYAALSEAMGSAGWAFATGQADTLADDKGSHGQP